MQMVYVGVSASGARNLGVLLAVYYFIIFVCLICKSIEAKTALLYALLLVDI